MISLNKRQRRQGVQRTQVVVSVEWVLNAKPVGLHLHGPVGPDGGFSLGKQPQARAHHEGFHAKLDSIEPEELPQQLPGGTRVLGLLLL